MTMTITMTMTMTMKYIYLDTYYIEYIFTSICVLLTLVIKIYMCPGDLSSANCAAMIKPPK